ncbi:MAG: TonB family protein [Ignavibacteriaceae bacterium]
MMKIIITVRLTFLILICSIILSGTYLSQSFSGKNISLICNEEPLRSVLDEIHAQAGINFIYKDNLIDNKNITCRIKGSHIKDVLNSVLSGSDISFKEFGEKDFVLFKGKKPVKISYKAIVVDQNTSVSNQVFSFTKPEIINGDHPVYPSEAVKKNIEGKVKVRFLISKEGDVDRVIIEKTSGSEILDSAAVDYINKLKFTPAKENGLTRSIWMSMVLRYLVIDQ